MKRLILVWVMMLCLAPLDGWAESTVTEAEPLFPACGENGKWGYINQRGEFVIQPQFDGASDFRGNYAVITVYPDGFMPTEETDWSDIPDCEGIIDRNGSIVLEPTYSFDSGYDGQLYGGKDTGIWYVTRWRDLVWDENEEEILQSNRVGFFDIPSGCFSGLKWEDIWPWVSDSRLIPVEDNTHRFGYADRTTGELVIPCQYAADPCCFHGGVASVSVEDEAYDETGNRSRSACHLIDETGSAIPLPEGTHAVSGGGAFFNRVMVQDDSGRYGYADAAGHPVIAPQFIRANSFEETPLGVTAVVQFPEQDWGIIDTEGEIFTRGIIVQHWSGPHFYNGYRTEKTGANTYSLLDMQGETVFSLTIDHIVSLGTPMENGLCWFAVDEEGDETHWKKRRFGLVNMQGEIITDAVWIIPDFSSYSEGYHIVVQMIDGERKLGYLDDSGMLAIHCIFDDASDFENGLAFVRIGSRCGYIDKDGQEVYFWESEEEPDFNESDEEE